MQKTNSIPGKTRANEIELLISERSDTCERPKETDLVTNIWTDWQWNIPHLCNKT